MKKQGVKLDKMLTSPLRRAKQTADGVVASWGEGAPSIEECEYLAPGSKKKKLIRELLAVGDDGVAVVGHNPDLSVLIGWLIGEKEVGLSLAKAGVACIEFEGSPCKECGVLTWLVTPAWCA